LAFQSFDFERAWWELFQYWEEGTMAVALELKENDTVWVQTPSNTRLDNSCITIYKI
jgi:ketosteroid isomerase-like protein